MPRKKHPRVALSCIFALLLVFYTFVVTFADPNILIDNERIVFVDDNGTVTEIKTRKTNVGEILLQAEIKLKEHDYINIGTNEEITEQINNITIKRAVPLKVVTADGTHEFHTLEETVKEALDKQGIELSELDTLHDNTTNKEILENDTVAAHMEIKLVDVAEKVIEEETILPYEVITKENHNLDKGESTISQKGKTGSKITSYNARYEDGQLVDKEKISEEIIAAPVNEIKEIGMQLSFTTDRGSKIAYKDTFIVQATAYTASSDPYGGMTATGMKAKVGVVAVDKRVIPLGTKLYVESLDSTKDYGYCIAVDTGVKGKRIDLYYDTTKECFAFGRRNVRIYVLKDQDIDVFSKR